MIAFMPTPLIYCGSQLRGDGDVLVNDFGNAVRYLLFALSLRGLCPCFHGIYHDAPLPEKACGVAA